MTARGDAARGATPRDHAHGGPAPVAVRGPRKGRCWAVIVAGGSGARLGLDRPKAFVPLAGTPMLAWSVGAFAVHPAITDVLVVVPRGWATGADRIVLGPLRAALPSGSARIHRPVIGGAHRQDSVRAGLEAAARHCRGDDLELSTVLIHDAARPIVAEGLIGALLACVRGVAGPLATGGGVFGEKARGGDPEPHLPRGAAPVVPLGDTLKRVDELSGAVGRIMGTVDRDGLWRVQTPQAFPLGPLLHAHRVARDAGHGVTDDAMLFEWLGWPVAATAGSALGIKITYPEDLALLEGWLRGCGARRQRPARGPGSASEGQSARGRSSARRPRRSKR